MVSNEAASNSDVRPLTGGNPKQMTHEEEVDELRSLYGELISGRQDYDFQMPSLTSHADDHAGNPLRFRRYAQQVVYARIMLLLSTSRMNTQRLLQTYLEGFDRGNPFPPLMTARGNGIWSSVLIC